MKQKNKYSNSQIDDHINNVKSYYNQKDPSDPIAAMDYCIDGKPLTFESYKKLVIEPYIDLLELKSHHHILDVGCGTGLMLQEVEKLVEYAEGFDLSENLIKVFKGKSKVYSSSVLEVTYPPETFDRIYMIGVSIYFPNSDFFFKAIDNLYKFLKIGGFLLIGDQIIQEYYLTDKYFCLSLSELVKYLSNKKYHFKLMCQNEEKRYRNRYDLIIYKD